LYGVRDKLGWQRAGICRFGYCHSDSSRNGSKRSDQCGWGTRECADHRQLQPARQQWRSEYHELHGNLYKLYRFKINDEYNDFDSGDRAHERRELYLHRLCHEQRRQQPGIVAFGGGNPDSSDSNTYVDYSETYMARQ
jgi:hypothetical protein